MRWLAVARARTPAAPAIDPATLASIATLKARDPAFDPARFLDGARQAYETIVRGYASGDRAALKPALHALLDTPPADMRAALTAWAEDNGVELA